MIQFNLLPSVKVEYMKAKKTKRLVILISAFVAAASLGLLLITMSVMSFQKKHINDLNKDIKSYTASLVGTEDLSKILTIQNQLDSLPALYAKRPAITRLYNYVQKTTPAKVSIININMDLEAKTFVIKGTSDSLESVNRYVDTLKFTTYTLKDEEDKIAHKAFSGVVLTTFSRDATSAAFTVTFSFAPDIFDSQKVVTLNVPTTTTTRSETELPTGVFDSTVNKQGK